MTLADSKPVLGFIGGTGPQGRGLALRFAKAGYAVLIGSRNEAKAKEIVAALGVDELDARGVGNAEASRAAEIVFITVPYAAQRPTLAGLADGIGDKIVVNCVNAVVFDDRGPMFDRVEAGSAAEECAQLLPRARVVSAFHDVSATRLLRADEPISVDVLICGEDEDAKAAVVRLASQIPGMLGVDCGALRLSGAVEQMTPVLLSINRRYKIRAGLRIDGIRPAP